jgi:hypothetical protein
VLSTLCLVHTAVLQWQSRAFRANPIVLCISSLLQVWIMAIGKFVFAHLSIWSLWKFGLIHLISPQTTWWWWYLAEVYCSKIWSGCLCPAKYLGTCNWVDPVWPSCIFRANCYYFPFTPAWLNTRTVSCLALHMHVQIFDVQCNVPCVMSLIIKIQRYENEN